jgi:hypothetical protein
MRKKKQRCLTELHCGYKIFKLRDEMTGKFIFITTIDYRMKETGNTIC